MNDYDLISDELESEIFSNVVLDYAKKQRDLIVCKHHDTIPLRDGDQICGIDNSCEDFKMID